MNREEYEAFFASNNIKQVAANIRAKVKELKIFLLEYPITNPKIGIGEEYSVIGRDEAHKQIAKMLKAEGFGCKKICDYLYVFYEKSCNQERLKNVVADAYGYAHWTDMIG